MWVALACGVSCSITTPTVFSPFQPSNASHGTSGIHKHVSSNLNSFASDVFDPFILVSSPVSPSRTNWIRTSQRSYHIELVRVQTGRFKDAQDAYQATGENKSPRRVTHMRGGKKDLGVQPDRVSSLYDLIVHAYAPYWFASLGYPISVGFDRAKKGRP